MDSDFLRVLQEYRNRNNGISSEKDGVSWIRNELNGKSRVIETSNTGDYVILYSFNEGLKIECVDERKLYEAINSVNEEISTMSVEFHPIEKHLRLKSSLVLVPGISLERAIEYYEGMHNKYFNAIQDTFMSLASIPNLNLIGKIIKEKANKS